MKITNEVFIGNGAPLALIAGPCVIESKQHVKFLASAISEIAARVGMPYVFKASFDKANRSSVTSYRGPGLTEGLRILKQFGIAAFPCSRIFTNHRKLSR